MPSPIIQEGWADALEPGIREWFWLGATRRPQLRPTLFNVINGTQATEHFENFGSISPDAWRNFQKSGQVSSVGFDRGYKTNITPGEFLVELPIRKTMIEDNLYPQIMQPTVQLGDSAALLMETDAASVFNNAFSASYLGGDAVALCSDSHPNGPEVSGTQDNNFTLALTKANLDTIRQAMMAFKDDKGNLVGVVPDTIIVPPALESDALVIAGSQLDPTSANNAINPMAGRFKVVVWHYLTDSNAFFVVDSMRMKMNLLWIERIPLEIRKKVQDEAVFATWIARTRYGFGWTDWRWIAGSNPS